MTVASKIISLMDIMIVHVTIEKGRFCKEVAIRLTGKFQMDSMHQEVFFFSVKS